MPEGDTIHYAARRIRPILEGRVPDEVLTPHPRFRADRWAERLDGRAVEGVDAHGKHLFLRFEGDLVIHSHLRMTGSWGTYRPGQRWRRSPRRAWLVLRSGHGEVVQFDGPVLELLTAARARADQRIAALGPDILAPEFGEAERARFLRRLREDDPTRPIGDALLDQRTIAGIGNLWKVEGCFAAGIDPWRRTGDVSDEEALTIVRETRPRMRISATDGIQDRFKVVYGKAGQPCPRCGPPALIASRGQGDGNRITYWCPRCQS
jgi:endonuclease VIII